MPDKFNNSCCFGRDNWSTKQTACLATLVQDVGLEPMSLRYPLVSLNTFDFLTVISIHSNNNRLFSRNRLTYSLLLFMNRNVCRHIFLWMISITSHGKKDAWYEDKMYVWKARSLGSSSDWCTSVLSEQLFLCLSFSSSEE